MLDMLRSEEQWSLNGLLSYYTILQLEVFCKRTGKGNEISYIETFMQKHDQRTPRSMCLKSTDTLNKIIILMLGY